MVWGTPEHRESLSSIQDLLIETPSAGLVRLGDVADVSVAPIPSVVAREGVMRYLDVTAGIDGRDAGAVVNDVKAAVAALPFDIEYHAEIASAAIARATMTPAALVQLVVSPAPPTHPS